MTRIGRILCVVVCLVIPFRVLAQSAADKVYNCILALQKLADAYQSKHIQDVVEGRAQLSFFGFGVPQETTQAIIDETKKLEGLAQQGVSAGLKGDHSYRNKMLPSLART